MNRSTSTEPAAVDESRPDANGRTPTPGRVRVLIVEDDPLDAELVLDRLGEGGLDVDSRIVADEVGFRRGLREHRPDIVLSDLSLPGFSGERALKLLRERDLRTPFVFVSGTVGEDAAIDALRGGATDYILKNNMARLTTAVRRALAEAANRRARDAAEDELVRSQRFETMAILAGSLSHDLRNILQPVLMASQLIENKTGDPEIGRMCVMIRDCCNQGLELVSAMLALARGGEGARSNRIRLAALVEAVGLLLRPSLPRNVELVVEEPPGDLEIPGNATELQQCLLNLALNGVQAMPDGGRLQLAVRALQLDDGFFRAGEPQLGSAYVQISVTDAGVGMDPATLDKLFTPFFTTKASGNGLGLVSCRRFVDKHRGLIRVHSEPGSGSCFDLYLPVTDVSDAVDASDPRPGRGQPVLVLCDTGPLCSQLLDVLDGQGYAPLLAASSSSAVRRLGESEGFVAVIVDAALPGEGSAGAVDALRRAGFDGPVIVVESEPCGDADVPGLDAALRLRHPLVSEALVSGLAKLLAEPRKVMKDERP